LGRAIAKIAEGGGNFLAAGKTQQADDGIAKGGEILRPMPLFHLAFVFTKADVPHPVQPVFDAPVATPMSRMSGWGVKSPAGHEKPTVLTFWRRPGTLRSAVGVIAAGKSADRDPENWHGLLLQLRNSGFPDTLT